MTENRSVETQLALLNERIGTLIKGHESAELARKAQYTINEQNNIKILSMDNRLEAIEKSFAESAPTIKEFITIKHKVVGAGNLGKFLWGFGGILITVIYSSREKIASWLTSF